MTQKIRFRKATRHTLPMAPPAGGGTRYPNPDFQVSGQDEPTTSRPLNAHKILAGHAAPGRLPNVK